MGNDGLTNRTRARFEQLFPENAALRGDVEHRLLYMCFHSVAEEQAEPVSRAEFDAYHHFLADKFKPGSEADYEEILRDFKSMWPTHDDIAWMCAAIHAEANRVLDGAMNCAMELIPRSRFSAAAARVIAHSMRTLLVADALGHDEREMYQHPLLAIIDHLATHPADAHPRVDVTRSMSVEIAGPFGAQLLGALAYLLHQDAPQQLAERARSAQASEGELEAFLSRFEKWSGDQGFELDPRNSLPSEVVGEDADKLVSLFSSMFELDMRHLEDLADLEFQAHLLPPLARHIPGCTDDIHALRRLAGLYTMFNDPQRSRDLAELVLQIAGSAPERRRLAWGAYADIYLRSHSFPDALLGLACAARTEAALPVSDLYQESYMLMRIARTQQLPTIAERFMQRSRRLLQLLDPGETAEFRLEVASLGLRQSTIDRNDLLGLTSLLEDCHRALEKALQLNDELMPPTFLCAQVAGLVERAGGPRPTKTWDLVDRATKILGPETATHIRTVSSVVPAPADLVATHNRMNNARYSADAPADAVAVTMAARRLLCSDQLSARDAVLACELLSDRGLVIVGDRPSLTPQWPEQCAQVFAQEGVAAVLMLALDDQGELVGAVTHDGASLVVRASRQQQSFRERMQAWSGKYPYAYGEISPRRRVRDEQTLLDKEVGDREFYDSMRPFDIPVPKACRVMVIADPEVAQLPCNLWLNGRELAGYEVAFGMVPSLSWLSATRAKPRSADARRLAWISEGKSDESIAAIDVVRAMTEETLQRHGVALDTSEVLPQDFNGARMAIITAHGQLMPDKKYFHRIADEGTLQESALELARALEGVELVILFVCSGGRVDRHPVQSTTVGLPKMLLNNGCRTVIASPWPLESLAPGSWLPAFLEHWDNGATAMDACHQANLQIARRRDGEPQVSLAMTVYGDPLLVNVRSV